jgi:hypothetical protein
MKVKISAILALVLLAGLPLSAGGKKKKPERAMLEKMEGVPCGAKEKGVTGLGTVWASAGITKRVVKPRPSGRGYKTR